MSYACPCCGYLTRIEEEPGSYDICPVCYWEDDPVQFKDPNFHGGANEVSLNEARENFIKYGASDKRFVRFVRKPMLEEIPNSK
ncbi:MAG: CPCC family cysteine-rich protein [Thermoactinomyces sp.]